MDADALGADDVHQESRPAVGRRDRRAVLRCGDRARPTPAGLLSDEHFTVDGSLLQAWASHKSFRPKDAAAGRWRREQSHGGFPRRDAAQRHASVHHGSGRAVARKGGETLALGLRTRTCCSITATGWSATSARRTRRARPKSTRPLLMVRRRRAAAARSAPTKAMTSARLSTAVRAARRHAARRRQGRLWRHRSPHDPACRVRDQSAQAEAGGAGVWLDEDRRRLAPSAAPRRAAGRLAGDLRGRRLQPGAPAHAHGEARVRRRVPTRGTGRARTAPTAPPTPPPSAYHAGCRHREIAALRISAAWA